MLYSGTTYSDPVEVYNGTELRHYDSDVSLQPYTYYEYRVWAYNGAGSVISQWTRVLTYQDVPEGLLSPDIVVCMNAIVV